MSGLTAFVGLMIAISMAVERCVEIVKGVIPQLGTANSDPKKDGRRAALIQVLAAVFGTLIAEMSKSQIASAVPPSLASLFNGSWSTALTPCLVIGLMASGGSGFWNHILDIIGAMKIKQEQAAQQAQQQQVKAAAAKA